MKKIFLPTLLLISFLSSCSITNKLEKIFYFFDSYENISLLNASQENMNDLEDILTLYDKLSDNYNSSSRFENLYSINLKKSEKIEINKELYEMFKNSEDLQEISRGFYNPLVGKLSKLYKESFANNELPDQLVVSEYLSEIKLSSIVLEERNNQYFVTKNGDAEIDFGAIAKGYVLDKCYEYLKVNNLNKYYIINCGSSSIALGEKSENQKNFNVGLSFKNKAYIELNNCFIGVSGVQEQGVAIEGVTYSHIINPFTGSAINNYDAVLVVGNNGALCDVLSTSFMMMDLESIKEIEKEQNVKALIFDNDEFVYINNDLEVLYH